MCTACNSDQVQITGVATARTLTIHDDRDTNARDDLSQLSVVRRGVMELLLICWLAAAMYRQQRTASTLERLRKFQRLRCRWADAACNWPWNFRSMYHIRTA